ncbi:MAG: hypothetical protein RMM17_06620 [Acidobacteriota bacterium]|nr:hypothetical protein [Blastocatellia bacterium]MDW8412337.1 hypothetical protein [Acidobacteriota bacterium]
MIKIWEVIKKIVLWSYDRGTWQYDLLAVLILAFIFLTPHSVLDGRMANRDATEVYIPASELAKERLDKDVKLAELLAKSASKRTRRELVVERIEPDFDDDAKLKGFRVYCVPK